MTEPFDLDARINEFLDYLIRNVAESWCKDKAQVDEYVAMYMPGYSRAEIKRIVRDVLQAVKPGRYQGGDDWQFLDKVTQDLWLIRHGVIDELEANITNLLKGEL